MKVPKRMKKLIRWESLLPLFLLLSILGYGLLKNGEWNWGHFSDIVTGVVAVTVTAVTFLAAGTAEKERRRFEANLTLGMAEQREQFETGLAEKMASDRQQFERDLVEETERQRQQFEVDLAEEMAKDREQFETDLAEEMAKDRQQFEADLARGMERQRQRFETDLAEEMAKDRSQFEVELAEEMAKDRQRFEMDLAATMERQRQQFETDLEHIRRQSRREERAIEVTRHEVGTITGGLQRIAERAQELPQKARFVIRVPRELRDIVTMEAEAEEVESPG